MEKTTWQEIKSLASDFKRAQETSSNLKLSERNCIDIIHYLCNSKLLTLHFTTDGKTFLTPEEITKEIYEELEVASGRVAFSTLCTSLDLDSYTIENAVNTMVHHDSELQIVTNSLINSSYVRQIALRINGILKERGRSTLAELTQLFDLPKMFLEKVIVHNLGTVIDAHKDGDTVYTSSFVRRHTAMIRGFLSRSSQSVSVSSLIGRLSIPEKLVTTIISELVEHGRLCGKLDHQKSVFVPEVYLMNQRTYLRSFFSQNDYLQFSTMRDVGVLFPAKFAESEFPGATLLSSCIVGDVVVSQLEAAVQECDRSDGFVDCYESVPTSIEEQDLITLINNIVRPYEKLRVVGREFVVSCRYIEACLSSFDEVIRVKSEEFVTHKKKPLTACVTESIEEERPIKMKYGGGQRGREIKNKAVKNKYFAEKKAINKQNEDHENVSLDFMTNDEAVEFLASKMEGDVPLDLLNEIFLIIEKQLNIKFKKECHSAILRTSDTARMKVDHKKLETNISSSINKIKLIEKGLMSITNASLRNDLTKYCMKSLCSELVNSLFECIARDNEVEWDVIPTNEMKAKLIGHVRVDLANQMRAINKSMKDESFEVFYASFDSICLAMDLFPKKLDKKNEKRLIQEIGAQYHSILDSKSLDSDNIDPGELLLLTTLLLFQRIVGHPLHASGKFVPEILLYLQTIGTSFDDSIDWLSLKNYQNYVMTSVKMSSMAEEEKSAFKEVHKDLHQKVLQLALNWKQIKAT